MATNDDRPLRPEEEPTRSHRNPGVWVLILLGVLAVLALGAYGVWYWVDSLGKDEHEEYWAKRVEMDGGQVVWDEQGPYRKVRKVIITPRTGGDAFWCMQFLHNIKELGFRNTDFDGKLWRFVEQYNLESLDVAETKFDNSGIRTLVYRSKLRHLQQLDLSGTAITDAGLAYLVRLTKLRMLALTDTAITDQGLVHLKQIPTLQSLNLRGTKVTDAGVAALQQALPQLKIER